MNAMMTMRSAMKVATLFFMATAMTTSMTSCSNDDDGTENVTPAPANHGEMKKTVTLLTIIPTEDAAKFCEYTVDVIDSTGAKQTLTVDKTLWIKSIETDCIPAEGSIVVHQKVLPGAQLTKDKYNIGATVLLVFSGKYADGTASEASKTQLGRSHTEQNLTKADMEKYLIENPIFYSTKYSITKDTANKTVVVKEKKFEETPTGKVKIRGII